MDLSRPETYRDGLRSSVHLPALVLSPPEKAGAVIKALRGLMYVHRGVRNVADLHVEPGGGSTDGHPQPGRAIARLANDHAQHWLLEDEQGAARGLKALLLEPTHSTPAASATRHPSGSTLTLYPTPLSPDDAARLGLGSHVVDRLNALTVPRAGAPARAGHTADGQSAAARSPEGGLRVATVSVTVTLTYENYTMAELLRAVLPSAATRVTPAAPAGSEEAEQRAGDVVALSGFEQVGHIAHVNLSRSHLPYKGVIGLVILDCNSTVDVVVNKTDSISSQFREFPMEVIAVRPERQALAAAAVKRAVQQKKMSIHSEAEEKEAVVNELLTATVRQHSCVFEVPYNRVYWNSRLSHEHTRLVNMMGPNDVLFDAMAGVGPFAVPAAMKGLLVFGNDLNPSSAAFMERNRARNKIDASALRVFCWDGRDFLNEIVYSCVMGLHPLPASRGRKHVVMNLPATAVEFLDVFAPVRDGADSAHHTTAVDESNRVELPEGRGWYRRHRWTYRPQGVADAAIDRTLLIHVYCFSPVENVLEDAVAQVEQHLGYRLAESNKESVVMVRDVSPQKRMVCVSFTLPDAFWAHQTAVSCTGGHDAIAEPHHKAARKE